MSTSYMNQLTYQLAIVVFYQYYDIMKHDSLWSVLYPQYSFYVIHLLIHLFLGNSKKAKTDTYKTDKTHVQQECKTGM